MGESMPDEARYLRFDGMSQAVELCGCDALLPHLALVFPGWKIEFLDACDENPILSLSHDAQTYSLQGYWIDEPLVRHDEVDALCALVAELMRAYVRQDERLLCLHAAAADFNGRLVVFPSRYRAGKSVLSACLAAAGTRLFCDDILPLNLHDANASCPGLAPRLRLPLPGNLRYESRNFIESRTRLSGRHYSYLDLDSTSMATRNEQMPIGAFVLLERQEGVEANLESLDEAEVLAQVVWQNFAREAPAPSILSALNRLVAGSKRFLLRYDRAEDAVSLLQREFSRWPDENRFEPTRQANASNSTGFASALQSGCYRQAPGITMVEVDDQCFLADQQGNAIHHLNPVGSSIWGLLAEPMSLDEIVDLLASAFPGQEREQIAADVSTLVHRLKSKNLLHLGA